MMPHSHKLAGHVARVHDAHRAAHDAADAHGTDAHAHLQAMRASTEPLPTPSEAGAMTEGTHDGQG